MTPRFARLRPSLSVILFTLTAADSALAQQHRVDDRNHGERLVMIVPVIGDGRPGNPFRPLFIPEGQAAIKTSGIIGFTSVLSDDRKFALLELIATDRKAFEAILKDPRPDVKKFDESKGSRREEIELEFKKLKKDFDFTKFKEGK